MHIFYLEKRDQSTNSGMEESAAMTIEFLRACLLSERSVSRSARQRADELARRVEALEEQLMFVSLQRKKAEKATADVLAILEDNGISDVFESYDSSSDQETPFESKVDNNSAKEDKNSINSKFRSNESGELSGSDLDFSPVLQRSLSWKDCKATKHSPEKYKDSYKRRGSSFPSVSPSSKHIVGKSCHQIRQKESRSMVEEVITEAIKVDSQENGVAASLEVCPNDSDGRTESMRGGSEPQEEKLSLEGSHLGHLENGKNVSSSDVEFSRHGIDSDMEKALEHQAQLIGKYEEMEKAQREWEERFRENNSSTPDSCDPGNQSDVTEEREEIKLQAQCPANSNNFEQAKSKVEDVHFFNGLSNSQSNGFVPPSQNNMQPASESLMQDFAFPTAKERHIQENLENNHYLPSHSTHNHLHLNGSPGNQSTNIVSSNTSSSSGRGDISRKQNKLYALVPHEQSNGFNGVLESLKQARLSLQQKISSLSSTESGPVGKAIEPSVPAIKFGDREEIPVGFGGLFRLPTDFAAEASKTNFLDSGSQPNLASYYPNSGLGITTRDQAVNNSYMNARSTYSADNLPVAADPIFTRPYMDMRSSVSIDDRLFTSQFRETESKVSAQSPTFDQNLEAGQLSSRQYTRPTFPSYPVREGFSTRRSVGMPAPTNHLSFYNDHTRPTMYR